MLNVAQIRERIRKLEEEDIPEAIQMKKDFAFAILFKSLLVKTRND